MRMELENICVSETSPQNVRIYEKLIVVHLFWGKKTTHSKKVTS